MHSVAFYFFILASLLISYHHLIYPLVLKLIAKFRQGVAPGADVPLNYFTFIIPMHNEALFIAKKLANLDALDYPKE
ncbi:MAG: hypothetical protein WC627_07775, partial [Legionella sp.]